LLAAWLAFLGFLGFKYMIPAAGEEEMFCDTRRKMNVHATNPSVNFGAYYAVQQKALSGA
jgi:hypothetical protein